MKLIYTPEQRIEVLSLKQQGLKLRQIAVKLNLPVGTVGTIIHRSEKTKPEKKQKKPQEKPPKQAERRELNLDQKLRLLAVKRQQAQQRLDNTQLGDKITVMYPAAKGYRAHTGIVETKYLDKLIIRNSKGRRETVTLADLLTYKVVEG